MIKQGRNRERKRRVPDTKLCETLTLKEVKEMIT